jgi:hypothetical protein
MNSLSTPQLIGLILAVFACWSGVRGYLGKFGTIVGSCGMVILCGGDFVLGVLIQTPHNIILLLAMVILLPLMCAFSFTWRELATEFDPTVGSKGWGLFAFLICYVFGLGAFVTGLFAQWLTFQVVKF